MSIFTKVWDWLKKAFTYIEKDADKVAITLTEGLKDAMQSGVVGFIAAALDGLTKSHVPTEIVTFLSNNIDKVLATELAIQGIPDNPTQDDILAFEQAVLKAFNVTSDKSRLYTTLAAQTYGMLKAQADAGTKFTFALLVKDVELAYQNYLNDQNGDEANP